MTTILAIQLPRINLANGGSMQSAQVVTLKSGATGPLPRLTQNRQCTHGASYKLNTSALLPSHVSALSEARFQKKVHASKVLRRAFDKAVSRKPPVVAADA